MLKPLNRYRNLEVTSEPGKRLSDREDGLQKELDFANQIGYSSKNDSNAFAGLKKVLPRLLTTSLFLTGLVLARNGRGRVLINFCTLALTLHDRQAS